MMECSNIDDKNGMSMIINGVVTLVSVSGLKA